MKLKHSIFAVIATHPDGRTERLIDCDTREEAEDRAQAEAEYAAGGERFEVRLLDRRQPAPKAIPAGVECFLMGATAAERERCLAVYR
jgi:hypothetical protein